MATIIAPEIIAIHLQTLGTVRFCWVFAEIAVEETPTASNFPRLFGAHIAYAFPTRYAIYTCN